MVIRANKAKTKTPEAVLGEIVTVKGFMSKLMRIGKFIHVFGQSMGYYNIGAVHDYIKQYKVLW